MHLLLLPTNLPPKGLEVVFPGQNIQLRRSHAQMLHYLFFRVDYVALLHAPQFSFHLILYLY